MMRIAQIIAPIKSLGPGERIGLWVQGCHRNCEGCISPEYQGESGTDIPTTLLAQIIKDIQLREKIDKITISGGEPFEQPEELKNLLREIREGFSDVLLYTGFELKEIALGLCGESGKEALEYIDVLIDSPYIDALNNKESALKGSDNQVIHFLNKAKEKEYLDYIKRGRIVENKVINGMIYTIGIMNRGGE